MDITLLNGRLGNQLFEYAFARAQYFRTGKQCVLSEAPLLSKNINNRLNCFTLPSDVTFVENHRLSIKQRMALSLYSRIIGPKERMKRHQLEKKAQKILSLFGVFVCENGFIIPGTCNRDMVNIGYFQSEKYFMDFKDEILNELQFKDHIKESVKGLAYKISSSEESTCLHVRLGDYMKNPLHGVADATYYKRAIAELKRQKPNAVIFLFSDNVDLAKQELELDDDIECIPPDIDDQQTMYLGGVCRNFVISNSSFSWWMQYLSRKEDRLVFAPSRWYAQPCPCDIYQGNWKLVNV